MKNKNIRASIKHGVHKDMQSTIEKINKRPFTKVTQEQYIEKAIENFNNIADNIFCGENYV